MKNLLFLSIGLLFFNNLLVGQNLSQKKISLLLQNQSALEALEHINAKEGVKLSYNPDAISTQKVLSKEYIDQPLELILKDLLGDQFELKYRGSYVIIQHIKQAITEKKTFKISGQVKDAKTGEQIKDVTIYEVNKLSSTLTDDEGIFELAVAAKTEKVTFSISRENYQDTIIQVSNISQLSQRLVLQPVPQEEEKSNLFEIETKKLVQFFTTKTSRQNVKNVKMEEERLFQFSLVPMLGTNGKLSGQVTNNISLNLLAGYSNGTKGLELGGIYNINRTHTTGLQIAGFGNASGGQTKGVQLAGFINTTKGYTSGVQAAGFFNLVTDEVKGVQAAGFFNMATNNAKGLQVAGFLNLAKETTGSQVAGFANVATRKMTGAQISGFSNTSADLAGTQISGFINVAKEMKGFQLAGFVNYAKKLKGVQLSVINIADTVENGVTIGLFNFVKKGKHQFALEHNDFMDAHVSFRMGTDAFYSVLSSGMKLNSSNLWSYGFGFGTQYKIKNKLYGNVELSSHSVNKYERGFDNLNIMNRLDLNIGYKLAKHLSLNAGPVLNIYVTDIYDSVTGTYGDDFGQSPFYNETTNGVNVSMWIGYAASIRF